MGNFQTMLLVFATLLCVYFILRVFGVFEFSKGVNKTNSEIDKKRNKTRKARLEQKYLNLCSSLCLMFEGFLMPPIQRENHEYYIQRLELHTKYLGRLYTPEEVRGMHYLPFVCSFACIPIALFKPMILIVNVVCLMYAVTYVPMYKGKIADENKIIDDNFIKLYLTLFSKLRQGSRARLKVTLENYSDTLDKMDKTQESIVMGKFAKHFLNLLSMSEDHVAVPKLRELYDTPVIIGFCNIATQSLNGVDNLDALISFKVQLLQRQTEMMKKRQQVLLAKGNRSIYAIWIILFIMIVVGWWSKLPTDMIGTIFGK